MITVQLVFLAWHPGLHIFGIFRIAGIFGIDAFISLFFVYLDLDRHCGIFGVCPHQFSIGS
jgi:hypothetical protein